MSQNDYHMIGDDMRPGLGDDEPTPKQKADAQDAGMKRVAEMRAELAQEAQALTDKERELAAVTEAQANERRELEELRKALEKRASEAEAAAAAAAEAAAVDPKTKGGK